MSQRRDGTNNDKGRQGYSSLICEMLSLATIRFSADGQSGVPIHRGSDIEGV